MNKKELLEDMSITELQEAIWEKQEKEMEYKFHTKKEVEYNLKEIDSLEAEGNGSLYLVNVQDGCEGLEMLVEIERGTLDDWFGDVEEFVRRHIINFMIDEDYYPEGQGGGIEEIRVEEICRYGRPIFKIYK